jgi:serine/threonine protein kinase
MLLLLKPFVVHTRMELIINSRVKFVKSLRHRERVNFSTKIPGATANAIDLLEKILVFDPKSRITAAEALNHPYLAGYKEELLMDEMQTKAKFDWSFSLENRPLPEWKRKVEEMIRVFKADAKPRDLVYNGDVLKC